MPWVAAAPQEPDGCPTAAPGTGYAEAAEETGGVLLSVCADDWSAHFEHVDDMVTGDPTDTFVLTYPPKDGTLEVTVDDTRATAWTWSEPDNAVIFDAMPAAGAPTALSRRAHALDRHLVRPLFHLVFEGVKVAGDSLPCVRSSLGLRATLREAPG